MTSHLQDLPLEIDVRAVKSLIDAGEPFCLVDCREQDEYARVKLEGSRLIPTSEIALRIDELEELRHERVIVHCHLGGRSLQVTHWLRQQGFAKVQNMTGGIDAWAIEVDPTLPRY